MFQTLLDFDLQHKVKLIRLLKFLTILRSYCFRTYNTIIKIRLTIFYSPFQTQNFIFLRNYSFPFQFPYVRVIRKDYFLQEIAANSLFIRILFQHMVLKDYEIPKFRQNLNLETWSQISQQKLTNALYYLLVRKSSQITKITVLLYSAYKTYSGYGHELKSRFYNHDQQFPQSLREYRNGALK